MRTDGRSNHQIRNVTLTRNYTKHAEGSVLVGFGETLVLCTASLLGQVPRFLKGQNKGWLTAEYGMLPRATHSRSDREAARGKQTGRTQEIQRLIGRSLRACVDLEAMPDHTIQVDCDVIQADGGTRTAAITGACVAVYDAITQSPSRHKLNPEAFKQFVASVSVGIVGGEILVDLNYQEDSNAQTDMNVVMNETHGFIEVQGTAEAGAYSQTQLSEMTAAAEAAITQLVALQKAAIQ